MLVHTLIASIRTCPKPTIFAVLHGFDKEFANLVSCSFWISVLGRNNCIQLLFIPVHHIILLFFFILLVSRVFIQIFLLVLPPYVLVVTKFALLALLTITGLEELTQHRLWIHTERHLLRL